MRRESADTMPSEGSREERAPVLQWLGWFLAPAAFFVHLQVGYNLVPWACTTHGDLWVHVAGLASALVAAAGTAAAWRAWMRAGREEPGEGGGSLPRTRFIGATGAGMSATLTLLLVAQWVAGLFISTCQ